MAKAGLNWCIVLASVILATQPARAQDFYQGKTVTLLAGAPAGGEHDKLARLVARHLAAHIPGKPTITVENRQANGGVDALNAFFADAPKDGTALHMPMPGMALLQALRAPAVRYDAGALEYVGNLSRSPMVLVTWWVTGFKTIDDGRRREMSLGAVGASGVGAIYPAVVNTMLRTRFKVFGQYRRDADVDEAIENTEIGGRIASWGSLTVTQPGWIAQKRLSVLFQAGRVKHPDLPDAPLLASLVANDRDRALLDFVSGDAEHARALVAPPGTPAATLGVLRGAFEAMAVDPAFLAEARAGRFDIAPTKGEDAAKAVATELRTPRETIERARAMLDGILQ